MMNGHAERPSSGTQAPSLKSWLPLVIVAALMATAFAMGWHKVISFRTIGTNYDALRAFVSQHLLVALALYVSVYIAAVTLSLPVGLVLTLAGGLLFGWRLGAPAAVAGATLGATVLFVVARSSIGNALALKAGPWLVRLQEGFRADALSYMLFLRLVPAFPFWLVNLAPALLGVPLRSFVIGTLIGILPGTLTFSVLGAGLGSVIEAQNQNYRACLANAPAKPDIACPYVIDTGALVTPEIVAAFVLLGLFALIPIAFKRWSKHHAAP